MSFYVRREGQHDSWSTPRESWTGPIRFERQAHREAQLWVDAGWTAVVEPSTPAIRAEVRAWEKAKRERAAA